MTKDKLYALLQSRGTEVAFLANVIFTQHRNPAKRLAGLKNLLDAGHSVRTAQFDAHTLLVDGQREAWQVLDYPADFMLRTEQRTCFYCTQPVRDTDEYTKHGDSYAHNICIPDESELRAQRRRV